MKKITLIFIFIIFSLKNYSQDGHVLLTLSLDSVFSKVTDKQPGGSIFIERNGEILYARSFGLANVKEKKAFDENTVINIGKVAETFVSYAVLILQQQGKLSIDDSLIKYFPAAKNTEQVKKIKLTHLLNHTSGLQNIQLTNNNISGKLIDTPAFEPGSNYSYSNVNYSLLALIIEKVSGEKWQDFIQKNILAPAGMIHSKISGAPVGDAMGYRPEGSKFKEIENNRCDAASILLCNNVYSSLNDMRKYINAIKECVFVKCSAIESFSALWIPANWRRQKAPEKNFIWFTGSINKSEKFFSSQGVANGYCADVVLFKNTGISIICLSNNFASYKEHVLKTLTDLKYIQ